MNAEKQIAQNGPFVLNQYTKEECYQNETKAKKRTSEKIADEYGVGRSTIIRNANFAKVVDILPEEVKHDVLGGEDKISHTMTDAILNFDKPTQKKFLKEKNGITFLTIWQRKIPQ